MAINRQANKGITKEDYFNNNGKGFDSPYIIKINDLNIKVEVYSHNLRASKIAKAESEIRETASNFKSAFGLERSGSEQTFKIYMFDDKADYTNLGGNEDFDFRLGNEGGKIYYRGEPGKFVEMFVYQQGGVYNLQHEFAHGLTYYATGGKSLPTVLMEGIADYFEHHSDHKFNSQGSSIDRTEGSKLDLSKILNLEYSANSEENSLVYKTGQALVMYLQEKHPNLLSDYLSALGAGDSGKSQNFLNQITQHNDDFKDWLSSNNTETAMREINALQVTKGEYIATKKEVVDGEIKDVSYYRANIEKMNGDEVGSFSPVEHTSFHDVIRATNKATGDLLQISKGEYSFLKVVSTLDGKYKITYSNKDGGEYKDSQEYKKQVVKLLSKYDENIKQTYDDGLKDLNQQRPVKYAEINAEYREGKISYEEYSDKHRSIPSWYEKSKSSLLDEMIKTGLKQVKATKGTDAEKILEELICIDPNLIRSASHIDLQEGKIFTLKALGQGMDGALSLYDGNTKLGELLSETGLFKQVEGSNKESFFFGDTLHGLYVKYDGGAYMAITKEGGQYKASLIDGRKVQSDEYFDKPHLHENELLSPSVNHIQQEDLESLLLKDTEILDHKDSKHAQYSDEQKASGVIVEKGRLLDNKGTDRTDDDVHEAVVKQGDEALHAFKNMGFYVREEVMDEAGNVTHESALFIHDYGANVRFQFPNSITHLKLVQKGGEYKLVPATRDGNEHPEGMPDISDEYRYIDPVFAHEYETREYSHKHVNIGLINFDKYSPGKLFAVKHDPNDYSIQRNSSGEIVRSNGQAYFTKVKLFDGDEEVGMLSNNFHNFKGKIFFSADYNYSYNDFLASVSPQVEVEDMEDGSKKITFDQGKGDIGDTNRGYTDHQRIFTKGKQAETQKQQVSKEQDNPEYDTPESFSYGTPGVIAQVASDAWSGISDWWSGSKQEEKSEAKIVTESKTHSGQSSLRGLAGMSRDDEMQSDQPQQGLSKSTRPVAHKQEQVVLKDTILKIEKSRDQDSDGKHKVNVVIDYNDIKSLYHRAEGADKQSVLKFWHKLHASEYKVGVLPEEKYYFKDSKFVIHDSDAKKLVVLPADKISIKIMKLGADYDLVITNENGKVIGDVSRVDHLNYELLSDASGFSLETFDSIELSDLHSEYDSYLISGLGGKMFDCPSYHNHDHDLI
ncbi:collagenase [Wolbachia endosymbiont of Folsomia candida]|uniref:collagenase n=1 Tax=Wolbachia endosymbiont of Folsomia candida TaxID=169402 RepID=UPI000A9313E6|nr:collagenase [Wolbachia endosymbiont of Folsomia candida]APR98150.1 peptidase M2 [Wolbachia endosymbiont of Folsomia candida]